MKIKLMGLKVLGMAGTQLVSVWLFVWLFHPAIVWYWEAVTGAY